MLFDFYASFKQYKEAYYQEWIFSYAYSIYYNLFIVGKKLNHRNYSEQELNMGNFVKAMDHDVHMYAKFGYFNFYGFL
jgi:hypothetical protein